MAASFIVLNDIHLADVPPRSRLPGYQDQIFDKLVGISNYAYDHKIGGIIATGDVFHQKRPSQVTHQLVNRLIDCIAGDFGDTEWYICPGNHDLMESGIESLPKQPLGTLANLPQVHMLLTDNGFAQVTEGKTRVLILGRNFDTDGDLDPAHYVCTPEEEALAARYKPTTTIMVAHGSLTPPGRSPVYPHLPADQVPWQDSKLVPDILLAGHLHEDWGMHKLDHGPCYVNYGSLGRPSRNRDVDEIYFLVIKLTDDGRFSMHRELVPNVLPAAEVFNEKVEEFEHDEEMAEFARSLAHNLVLEETSIDDALTALGDIPDNVKARMKRYLEENGY